MTKLDLACRGFIYTYMNLADITDAVTEAGFVVFGGVASDAVDMGPGRTLVLVGNAGDGMWRAFSQERPDTADPDSNPLDTWTRTRIGAVVADLAGRFDVTVNTLFPFDGPPYHPFQRWATVAIGVHQSPIGPLIHPEFGLWHGYRAALLVDAAIDLPSASSTASPCDSCSDKPCLSSCPVAAFADGGLNVAACTGHLAGDDGEACFTAGCLARRACPVGTEFGYSQDQGRFHMRAFFDAHQA